MSSIEQARAIIASAESKLREVLAVAAREGDYDSLIQLTRWASILMDLAASSEPAGKGKEAGEAVNGAMPVAASPRRQPVTRVLKAKGKASATYPHFVRRGDSLIKIGWSKKSKEEYQHKAPKEVLGALSQRLAESGRGGKLVSANDLTPIVGPDNSEIPDYQVYLCLAWLRDLGLITQEGRQGYSIPEPGHLPERVIGEWERLASDAK
jgi:hypothetical protein